MSLESIKSIFEDHKNYFSEGETLSISFRKNQLARLRDLIEKNEKAIHDALKEDLGKSEFEAYVSETGFCILEIDKAIHNIDKWARTKSVSTSLLHFPASSYIKPEPLGTVLIISPWNYPFQLLISPLVGAIAAGNTAILKPSEVAPATSRIVADLIKNHFSNSYISVVEGAVEETQALLDLPFDYIFYTGNEFVGKIVMEKASKHLTPVTLELGGKSPCFIVGDVDLDLTIKRITWGKFFNAGQTCVAPDYLLVEEKHYEKIVPLFEKYINELYGKDPKISDDYGKIINQRHFDRLMGYFTKEEILLGGDSDREAKYISPTILKAQFDSSVMREEIFGPLCPLIKIKNIDEGIKFVNSRPKPLALYIFTNNEELETKILERTSSGGVCINDTLLHLSSDTLPFGGVGASGMGMYHGKFSFDTFSHFRAVMKRRQMLDIPIKYPPYTSSKLSKIRKLLKFMG
ncbi:MAG: aldehyde dehydrogenase [Deltaproteobacteria bacterium]|jgi:aldehyde dehydrogenase (NAD+)|nr:MAG: aldehyde dehydrogenase [Deltaproteobacteria bacterium]